MSTKAFAYGTGILIGVVALVYVFFGVGAAGAEKSKEIRWLLSHQPTDVFARAADVFRSELEKETSGSLTLRVITPQDIGILKGDVPNEVVLRMLRNGETDIATAYTVALGFDTSDMWAPNLPFLFSNHAAVSDMLDGSLGESILSSLSSRGDVLGLAFTMSGGYRIIASKNTAISSLKDIAGKRIATSGGPVAEATLRSFGAEPIRTDLEAADPQLDASTIDGVEITYSRLGQVIGDTEYTKFINETNHSVFLTAILTDSRFFASLTPTEQAALQKAALAAARVEREDSRILGESVKAQLKASGSTITELSTDASTSFVAAAKSVYDAFVPQFTDDVASAIQGK
jgi:C4-dicarboxylate-binding protein DctP